MSKPDLTPEVLAKYFDHTQLKAYAAKADIEKLCDEARRYGFAMVAVNSVQVPLCGELLRGCDVHVGAAISFPLGQTTVEAKLFETRDALAKGADEIDYVVNLTELKSGNLAYVEDEMRRIVAVCREKGAVSKVIFETCYLTDDEKKALCEVALKVLPDYVKTSTGFGTGGATLGDLRLMKSMVGDAIKVKASGGVHTLEMALQCVEIGVSRIGSSASVAIVDAYRGSLQ